MINVGLTGGALTVELGTANEMQVFFDCVSLCSNELPQHYDWSIVRDKLYRRYLNEQDAETASELMSVLLEKFKEISCASEPWVSLIGRNISFSATTTLAQLFERYFNAYSECLESARVMNEEFKDYPGYKNEPIKIVRTDMPQNLQDQHRPLSEYESLKNDELPFWCR